MKKEILLVKNLSSLLKQTKCPRFLHRFGPKTYELAQHVFGLLVKEVTQMSFRRVAKFLKSLGVDCPSYSALCKRRKKIPTGLWQELLTFTAGACSGEIAIDSTGLSMNNPSHHYVKRIDGKTPRDFAKVSIAYDTKNKKICAVKVGVNRRHDIKDVKYLLRRVKRLTVFRGDSAYDAEWLHEDCYWRNCQTYIKPRRTTKRGFFRKKQMKNYSSEKYHQRNLVESAMRFKSKYGGDVKAKGLRAIQAEVYLRMIASNLMLKVKETFN